MNRLTLTLLSLCLATPALAQTDQTLLGDHVRNGFYGAPVFKISEVGGDFATFAGGQGGWIINNQFIVGLAGYGLIHPEKYRDMGYGGLLLGAMIAPHSKVHVGIQALLGAGATDDDGDWGWNHDNWNHDNWNDDNWDDDNWDNGHRRHDRRHDGPDDTFFVCEPELVVRINFAKRVRLMFSGGYRFVDGSDQDSTLSGYTASFAVGIGRF
jgi:hypothetical protein